jgi:hypothetical protein
MHAALSQRMHSWLKREAQDVTCEAHYMRRAAIPGDYLLLRLSPFVHLIGLRCSLVMAAQKKPHFFA